MALSFATFNLKNLQLAGKPTYPNSTPATQAEYDNKVEWTANQIPDLDADEKVVSDHGQLKAQFNYKPAT